METTITKKKRNKITKYDTSYCFDLSSVQLDALRNHSKLIGVSMARIIREGINMHINQGRI